MTSFNRRHKSGGMLDREEHISSRGRLQPIEPKRDGNRQERRAWERRHGTGQPAEEPDQEGTS